MIQRLSSRPDTDSDTDADLEVNTESLLIPTLGVGVGIDIGVESQHIQTAAKSVHLSIVDNRKNEFTAKIPEQSGLTTYFLTPRPIVSIRIFDGVVKSPISALRCIPRHCDVR
jgi:hypothetical protein